MSDLQKLLSYREPVFNAPMAGAASGALAAAVATAGGVGMIGVPAATTQTWVDEQARLVRDLELPWGAGFMGWALERDLSALEWFLGYDPALICISFGDPTRGAALAHEAGVSTAMQVGSAAELNRALEDDIDVVIVRGAEGGGHGRNEIGTLPLLQLAIERTRKPVIAAGGIATAHGVAAALAGGAEAVWVGTRFLACSESSAHQRLKERALQAGMDDTVYTRAFDIAQQLPWDPAYGGRAVRNTFSDRWADRIPALEEKADESLRREMVRARTEADVTMAPVYAGQSVEFVRHTETAAEVIAELAEFREVLAHTAQRFS